MNYAKKTLLYFIGHTSVGIIALLYAVFSSFSGGYREGMISGIIGGFITTGVLGIFFSLRLMKNPKRAAEVEMVKNEERTQFLRMKTSAAIFSVMIYAESAGILVTGLLGFREICLTLATILIIKVILYIGFASYYSKKY
ncbi:hypothetical protein [Desulfosporosinus meridiei]|uniref:Uncharacterized protein n=1 Tax=Desulfosporosinus meridiei (strain ATCC BAA-275 / DSM 13257 / KCTC 12902 / NCIMB 13706 / S10) TaxID=768704 RepID=J7IQ50_DESMD|nr:hypothetical protein [Desulfosporosinus meridiei]AFQ43982.1 hypothetical protein Desmer_2039 [Desulfosporosinus meridiei DSM 13257]